MSTVFTVGSGTGGKTRTYSTITTAVSNIPATPTGGYELALCNDYEFSEANGETFNITITKTTSASNYVTVRTATAAEDLATGGAGVGQSFRDNANASTNALKYNQSNGVGIKTSTTSYAGALVTNCDYVTFKYLQINCAKSNSRGCLADTGSGFAHTVYDSCIAEAAGLNNGNPYQLIQGLAKNCVGISLTSGQTGFSGAYASATYANCTSVSPSTVSNSGNAFSRNATGGTSTYTNCAGFGFANFNTNSSACAGSNNCSDKTIGFGSSNQASKTYTNQFVGTTTSTRDYRLKAGADCVDNGTTDTTDIPAAIDIIGTSRPQGSAWDIGCWELVQAAASLPPGAIMMPSIGLAA